MHLDERGCPVNNGVNALLAGVEDPVSVALKKACRPIHAKQGRRLLQLALGQHSLLLKG